MSLLNNLMNQRNIAMEAEELPAPEGEGEPNEEGTPAGEGTEPDNNSGDAPEEQPEEGAPAEEGSEDPTIVDSKEDAEDQVSEAALGQIIAATMSDTLSKDDIDNVISKTADADLTPLEGRAVINLVACKCDQAHKVAVMQVAKEDKCKLCEQMEAVWQLESMLYEQMDAQYGKIANVREVKAKESFTVLMNKVSKIDDTFNLPKKNDTIQDKLGSKIK